MKFIGVAASIHSGLLAEPVDFPVHELIQESGVAFLALRNT
jgi:hypothetical protein